MRELGTLDIPSRGIYYGGYWETYFPIPYSEPVGTSMVVNPKFCLKPLCVKAHKERTF